MLAVTVGVALLSFHAQPAVRFAVSPAASPTVAMMARRKAAAPTIQYEKESEMQYRKRMAQDKTYTAPRVKAVAAPVKVALSPSEVKTAAAPSDGSLNLVGVGAVAAALLAIGLKVKQAAEYVPPPPPAGPPVLPLVFVGVVGSVALAAALTSGEAADETAEEASTAAPAVDSAVDGMSVEQACAFFAANPSIDASEKVEFLKGKGVSDFVIAQAECTATGMEGTVAGHPGEETAGMGLVTPTGVGAGMSVEQACAFFAANPSIDASEKVEFLKGKGVSDFVIAQAECTATGMEGTVAGHP